MPVLIRRTKQGTWLFPVVVTPKSHADEVVPVVANDEAIAVKVRALPDKGAANQAVIAVLAKALKLPKTSLSVAHGATSRQKQIALEGIADAAQLLSHFSAIAAAPPETVFLFRE
jgi:uncharacterized protein YggU (UPF0235/DUF167 family)